MKTLIIFCAFVVLTLSPAIAQSFDPYPRKGEDAAEYYGRTNEESAINHRIQEQNSRIEQQQRQIEDQQRQLDNTRLNQELTPPWLGGRAQ